MGGQHGRQRTCAATSRAADPRDREIGRRVRAQRHAKGFSQKKLAEEIGVKFQQVQKYESGVNRIGSGRLQRIAEVLGVSVDFFFADEPMTRSGEARSLLDDLQVEGAVRLVRAYSKIPHYRLRYALLQIVECLASAPVKKGNER